MIVIRGARVLTPRGLVNADVLIADGLVASVGRVEATPTATEIDGTGMVLGPGFVDLHVHFRDPGQTWKEDLHSGMRAAAAGGFTAVVTMPNTDPVCDSASRIKTVVEAASPGPVEVVPAGALTSGQRGIEMAHLDSMYGAGVRMFSDDGLCVADASLLRSIMFYLSDLDGAVVAQHGEDADMTRGGHMHEGMMSARLGIPGLPATAEEVILARDLVLAAETGVRYHAQHVSTAGSVELITRGKKAGLDVTAEVTPHHLALSDQELSNLDTNLKMYPPLRTPEDVAAVVEGLRTGVIDSVATDHAPHTTAEKDVPFEEAPRGVIGLETAFGVALAALDGDISLCFERMSTSPAKIAGLTSHGIRIEEGAPANLVLVDPEEVWTPASFQSRSANSAFLGRKIKGKAKMTISAGEIVHRSEP